MPRRNESILDILVQLPWWVSVLVAAIAYITLAYIIPLIQTENLVFKSLGKASPGFAPFVALFFLLPAPFSLYEKKRKQKLVDSQKDLQSIRDLSWRDFEHLVGEAYRRQGYTVLENTDAGPDGGIDLRLKKDGNRFLVQCKQWRTMKVGVKVVRELYGVMTAEHATGGIVITSGIFTQEARNFAAGKPIDLVEGNQLAALIDTVRKGSPAKTVEIHEPAVYSRPCPQCDGTLVLREAKRGKNIGQKFWGCSNYPKCRATEPYQNS
jgi:restriction system protein